MLMAMIVRERTVHRNGWGCDLSEVREEKKNNTTYSPKEKKKIIIIIIVIFIIIRQIQAFVSCSRLSTLCSQSIQNELTPSPLHNANRPIQKHCVTVSLNMKKKQWLSFYAHLFAELNQYLANVRPGIFFVLVQLDSVIERESKSQTYGWCAFLWKI